MATNNFGPLDLIIGFFTLTFVSISIILGIILISKYFKYKERAFILVGITWMLIVSPYWSDVTAFIYQLFTQKLIVERIYFFITFCFVPIAHIIWIISFTNLMMYEKRKKTILWIILIESILFEILFIIFIIFDPTIIGTQVDALTNDWNIFAIIYFIFSLVLFVGTGFLCAIKLYKSNLKEIKLKGIFLFIAFTCFMIGGIFDAIFTATYRLILIIARIIMIMSAFCFYIGFVMPDFIKKLFIKNIE